MKRKIARQDKRIRGLHEVLKRWYSRCQVLAAMKIPRRQVAPGLPSLRPPRCPGWRTSGCVRTHRKKRTALRPRVPLPRRLTYLRPQKRHRRSFSPSATGSASAIVQECLERLLLRRYSARSRRAHRKHSTIRGENLSDSACGGLRPE